MAINITDGFNLNYASPVDYRMVVADSTARLGLTYKYNGLKVFQTDNRNTYVYNSSGSNWDIENSNKISGTGSTNYIPKFTGTNSTTGSWEIGNSPIFASGSNVGIGTNNPRGSYTYLQLGGTSLIEDPYWYAGQSLPLVVHRGASTVIGHNWYWAGSSDAYFNSSVGSSAIVFYNNTMTLTTRNGSGAFVHNMVIYPGYAVFSDNTIDMDNTKSPMIRSQGSSSYSSQTTPDFTWYGDNTTGIFIPSANTIAFTNNGTESVRIESNGVFKLSSNGTVSAPVFSFVSSPTTGIYRPSADAIAFTNNGTESVRIKSNGYVGIGNSTATYRLTVSGLVQGSSDTSKTVGGQVLNVGSSIWYSDVHLLTGQVSGTNNGFIQVTSGDISYAGSNIGLTPYNLQLQPGGGQTILPTGSTSSPSLIFTLSGSAGIYSTSANKIGISSAGVNQITISQYDLYANIHNKGTNGIGDSGNSTYTPDGEAGGSGPWLYPSIASGTFTSIISNPSNLTSLSLIGPVSWMRVGNVVSVSGQVQFTVTSSSAASTFYMTLPIKSYFGTYDNSPLNGVGKIVGKSSGGDVAAIRAENVYVRDVAEFLFNPSTTGYQVMCFSYQYSVGTLWD